MAVDTPAKIAILGAGPIGLEAALYARFLGYDVEIYDRGRVAEHVRRWADERMNSPFAANSTSLGLAAVGAQDANYRPPDGDAILTGQEWIDRYLEPLSQTDLLADHLRLRTEVLSVARLAPTPDGLSEADDSNDEEQEDEGDTELEPAFQITFRRDGREESSTAHVVIDATGVEVVGAPRQYGSSELEAYRKAHHFLIGENSGSAPGAEPNYYLLGAKSAKGSDFLVSQGYQQIRELFAIIGGRAGLDLYRGMANLVPKPDIA